MTDEDIKTAAAFSKSWNLAPAGSVYTQAQFVDWLDPVDESHIGGKRVLELGCGNASLLQHMVAWSPTFVQGVELGDSAQVAKENMRNSGFGNWRITQTDLTDFQSDGFDFVYCIGVLHHLEEPRKGFEAVIRNTKSGGRFHCWVYGHEGNRVIRLLVEPLRRLCSWLPWWFTRYLVALPLSVPYFIYAKSLARLPSSSLVRRFPLYEYSRWIAQREFSFFHHVAFDQLIAPRTVYLRRTTIEKWLHEHSALEPGSQYIMMRNGNSWKFGGKLK